MSNKKLYWCYPKADYARLDALDHFDFDPCPNPRPDGFDGLTMSWGKSNWVNPPFTGGVMAWVRKAKAESQQGKYSRMILPMYQVRAISTAAELGAQIEYAGKPVWEALDDGAPNPCSKSSIQPCVFLIFRPEQRKDGENG